MRVLAGDGDHAAHVLLAVVAQVLAGERHAPALRVEEAQQQADDRRLAGAARAEERDAPARLEAQAEAVERGPLVGGVAGAHVLERDRERRTGAGSGCAGSTTRGLAVGQLEDPPAGRERRRQLAGARVSGWTASKEASASSASIAISTRSSRPSA